MKLSRNQEKRCERKKKKRPEKLLYLFKNTKKSLNKVPRYAFFSQISFKKESFHGKKIRIHYLRK